MVGRRKARPHICRKAEEDEGEDGNDFDDTRMHHQRQRVKSCTPPRNDKTQEGANISKKKAVSLTAAKAGRALVKTQEGMTAPGERRLLLLR